MADLDGLTDFLYLHDNRLTSLPPSLERLTRLRYLNIGENAFDVLPDCVCGMASLIELRVSGNRLTSLPTSVGRLSRLRELHLRNNKLQSLPDSIGMLLELRLIDLRGNPLTHRPAAVTALPRLDKLDLRWVTTLVPPMWIADLEAAGCAVYRSRQIASRALRTSDEKTAVRANMQAIRAAPMRLVASTINHSRATLLSDP